MVILGSLARAGCSPGQDTLWRVLLSGATTSGCAPMDDSVLATRGLGERPALFYRRAGNLLVATGKPEQGLDLLSEARKAGGPDDSLLAESAEALLSLGRMEQALAATYGLEGNHRSAFLLRERAKLFSLGGMESEARIAQASADSLDLRHSPWTWDHRPTVSLALSGRDDRESHSTDSAFARRRKLQAGFVPSGVLSDLGSGDTTTFLGRSASQYFELDWGGENAQWRLDGSASGWSVVNVPDLLPDPPWGLAGGLSLRRIWSAGAWSKLATNWQRSWRGKVFQQDDLDASLSSGWSRGIFSTSLTDKVALSYATEWLPSNTTSLGFGLAPSWGPRWSASGSIAYSGGADVHLPMTLPASIWRTRGVAEGIRVWRDDRHPPSWTLLHSDSVKAVPYDSAQMVRFQSGLAAVPIPDAQDVTFEEIRPTPYWAPSLSIGLSQTLPWSLRAGLGVATGWRLWTRPETIILADPWTPLLTSGTLVMARDEETGKLFVVTDTKGGTFVALDETRLRRDNWTSLSITLSWTPLSWTTWQIGWRATETNTNTADIDSTVASTRSTISVDGVFWW